jgi:hypothetical protein
MFRKFWKRQEGYILVLMLLCMPVFGGLALLVVDVSRGNNAQSDLYAAADSLALAGAWELDGGNDAIIRAKQAMSEIRNTVSLLEPAGAGTYIRLRFEDSPDDEYTVIFLTDIPDSDDEPITQAFINANATNVGSEAKYVLVEARSRDLVTVFFNPVSLFRQQVPIGAVAVATKISAACNVTPLYICNPFELTQAELANRGTTNQDFLKQQFLAGAFHGRLISLHPKGSDTEAPGNFDFLQVIDPKTGKQSGSAAVLRETFAGDFNPTCYDSGEVTTSTGAMQSIRAGLNIRFDMYEAPYNSPKDKVDYPAAANTRKGWVPDAGDACDPERVVLSQIRDPATGAYAPLDADGVAISPYPAVGYLENATMAPPGTQTDFGGGVTGLVVGTDGAAVGSGNWDFQAYWDFTYGNLPDSTEAALLYNLLTGDPFWNSALTFDADDNVILKSNQITTEIPISSTLPFLAEPSRYDVYRFEMQNSATIMLPDPLDTDPSDGINLVASSAPLPLYMHTGVGGETGYPLCSTPTFSVDDNPVPADNDDDRRIMFAAIIDCDENSDEGGGINTYTVNSFASIFMVDPMPKNGASGGEADLDANINVEIIGLSTAGGGGKIENFVRDEAVLVR